ncbi:NAD(P)-binding domain-containing protein [Ideonella sp. 4Y16]|uniref:NAD(P)-binding domain-containing protein n=1 Tax=Ideonella alba TaxID=2824118 RepID=A0A940YG21_9BURK|nr:NAD(P)-binding domain-containing protein [Ideonella alba]MBQ0931827.1 NAD(P)-binding domain-containing protein [Ideonella alba]MBQ0941730.1 NAD(P)-binding domain-containing protein [Ideonella alba]
MTISILGAGNVGMALARALLRAGQPVTLGVPEPARYADAVAALGPQARLTGSAAAIDSGGLVILAVPYAAALAIAAERADWQGRVLVDATNPLAPGLSGLSLGTTTSGAEQIAARARGARVVKAFNTTGAENMADSHYAQGAPMMPVAGDDAAARQQVLALATLIGFDAVDMGPLSAARYLEPLAMVWIHLAFKQGQGRQFAFARMSR